MNGLSTQNHKSSHPMQGEKHHFYCKRMMPLLVMKEMNRTDLVLYAKGMEDMKKKKMVNNKVAKGEMDYGDEEVESRNRPAPLFLHPNTCFGYIPQLENMMQGNLLL